MAAKDPSDDYDTLLKKIVDYYDRSVAEMEDASGDHLHLGFYDPGSHVDIKADQRDARIRMIDESLRFASISTGTKPTNILDVGCGIGGSSMYLATKFGAKCQGINISPLQVQRAQQLAVDRGLQSQSRSKPSSTFSHVSTRQIPRSLKSWHRRTIGTERQNLGFITSHHRNRPRFTI